MRIEGYDASDFHDEWFHPSGEARPGVLQLVRMLQGMPDGELTRRQEAAERALLRLGITFNVGGGPERIFPFDVVPRILTQSEWRRIESGLAQRVQASAPAGSPPPPGSPGPPRPNRRRILVLSSTAK